MLNKLKLYIVCGLLHFVNMDTANDNAQWDDAQNFMEWLMKRHPEQLLVMKEKLNILAHRANERYDDVQIERNTTPLRPQQHRRAGNKLGKMCYLDK